MDITTNNESSDVHTTDNDTKTHSSNTNGDLDNHDKTDNMVMDNHNAQSDSKSNRPTGSSSESGISAVSDATKTESEKTTQPQKDSSPLTFKMPVLGSKAGGFKIKSNLPSPVNVLKDAGKNEGKSNKLSPKTAPSAKIPKLSDSGEGGTARDDKSQTQDSDKNEQILSPVVPDKSDDKPIQKPSPKNEKLMALSPAEQLKQANISIPYKEPSWGGGVDVLYSLEVLKNGQIIGKVDLTSKSFHVFGRLPSCDVTMEHPSISRHHAVIQHCSVASDNYPVGWYLYDLDSTHGTWVNKAKLKPKVYYRLRVGHVLKFGGSSRLYILEGPQEDQDEESELSITEMKEQREKQKKTAEILREAELNQEEEKEEEEAKNEGCSWGIDTEDAVDPDQINPFAAEANAIIGEELYLEDPKKTLRGWFEREGYDLPEYEAEEVSFGKHRCRLDLPLDTTTGEPIIAEAVVAGKKKEAVAACALEACRILDRHGVLRQAQHASRKKKRKNWEEDDFYDSDEDTFLDRTGAIEKKRQERMKRAGMNEQKGATYESLVEKLTEVEKEIKEIEEQIDKAKAEKSAREKAIEEDALDAYMTAIKSGAMDTKTKIKLKSRLFELRKEEQKLRKLANAARPAAMPELKKPADSLSSSSKALPMFGKMKGRSIRLPVIGPAKSAPVIPKSANNSNNSVVEEDDEEDEEENNKSQTETSKNSITKEADTGKYQADGSTVHLDTTETSHRLEREVTTETTDALMEEERNSAGRIKKIEEISEHVKDKESAGQKSEEVKQTDAVSSSSEPMVSQKRHIKSEDSQKKKKPRENLSKVYCDDDPDYAVWVPPSGQTGDGKTHLNEKFGY